MKGSSEKSTSDTRYELIPEAHAESASGDPVALARTHLRGRWRQACMLAFLLAAMGVVGGYMLTPVQWESAGVVRVSAGQPAVLYGSGRVDAKISMNNFAQAQALLLASRDVAQMAVQSPQLRVVGWPEGEVGVQELQDLLTVELRGSDQFLHVALQHHDAHVAQAAVDAVLDAYNTLYMTREHINPATIESRLIERQEQLQTTLATLRQDMLVATDQYGIEALEQMHAYKVEELVALDQALAEIALTIASTESQMRGEEFALPADAIKPIVRREDEALQERERTLIAEIESWKHQYGPSHPMIRELNRQLHAVRIRLNLRQHAFDATSDAMPATHNGQSTDQTNVPATHERLLQREQIYQAMRKSLHEEAAELGNKLAIASGIHEHIDELRQQLSDTRKRLDALRVEHREGEDAALIAIASRASMPAIPVKDRRAGVAGAAGMFGFFAGFGIMMLCGMFDPRCRFASEFQQIAEDAPMLAIIPDVSGNHTQQHEQASLAVHQLRNALYMHTSESGALVLAVSSAGEGEGKTSLTLALGASFAATGARTLLIDGDVANPQLSRESEFDHMPGLFQALGLADGEGGEVHRTRTDHLWILPAGRVGGFDPRMLSCQRMELIVQTLRSQFDVIIIDTGSIMTSLSGEVCCACADQIVMLAARHQHGRIITQATQRLHETRSTLAGLVFNRAAQCDVRQHDMPMAGKRTSAAALIPEARTGAIGSVSPASDVESTSVSHTARKMAA